MQKFNWQNIRLLCMVMVLFVMVSFTYDRSQSKEIKNFVVEFQGNNKMFLTHEMVNNLLIQNLGGTSVIKKEKVVLNDLECALEKHPFIAKAEVFITEDTQLITKITQKSPVVRVINQNKQFYVDSLGNAFPLSKNFSARVPLVYGNFLNKEKKGNLEVFNAINKDHFLKRNIIAARLDANGMMFLNARDFDAEIIFGKPILISKKLKNYKAFYQYAQKDTLYKNYKSINLIFTQQVVCSK
jgi:cell division protein FtsQ